MLLGNGFLPMFSAGNAFRLTGATWALDGSGRAYNTPTLGAELLTNGTMEADANWSNSASPILNERSSEQARTGTYSRKITGNASAEAGATQSIVSPAGTWVSASFWYRRINGYGYVSLGGMPVVVLNTTNTWVEAFRTFRQTSTNPSVRLLCEAALGGYWDDATVKAILLPTTLATITGSAPTQTAAAKIHTLTTGTQAGVVSLLDSASNPQNFLLAYHDGTNVRLDKCVAGVYTNLITTAVAFTGGAQIEIRRPSGNTFQLWYNGIQRGVDQTVSDASIISNTIYGLFSTFSGNLFSEFSLGDVVIPFGF